MVKEEKRLQDFFDKGEEQISALLGSLKRVQAPGNFDLGVRGRIAAGRPVEKRAFRISVLAGYAIPLALTLLIGGYFGFNSYYSPGDINVPAIAETSPSIIAPQLPPVNAIAATSQNSPHVAETAAKKSDSAVHIFERSIKKGPASRDKNVGGGSLDQASRIGPRIIQRVTDHTAQVPVKDALSLMGIRGVYVESGWRVESAGPNSVAERSGIKSGDVIEAINDQAMTEKTSFKGKFSGKSVRVRRDGKSVDIILKN